jgi:uncharacterized pyridoxal phosphate-containing UPF0001 family protein
MILEQARTIICESVQNGALLRRALTVETGVERLSMGMSNDLEVAFEEGSTLVRVGTAMFGRPKKLETEPRP